MTEHTRCTSANDDNPFTSIIGRVFELRGVKKLTLELFL